MLGGAALAVFAPPAPEKARIDPQVLVADLDGRLRETAAGVHSRATTLAELPRLAAAVSTDAATVRDLAQDELAFRPRPSESITSGQVPKKDDGKPMVLLTLPPGAKEPAQWNRAGARLELIGGKRVITESVTVFQRDRADEVSGAIAVTWLMDLTPVTQKLDSVGAGARLELPSGPLAFGRAIAPGEATTSPALGGELGKDARLVLAVPNEPAGSPPLRPAGAGIALLGVIVGLLLARRRPAAAANAEREREPAAPVEGAAPSGRKNTSSEALAATSMSLASLDHGAPEGVQIGRYNIVRRLGSGGMAEVYLARASGEAGFEKMVALKVLNHSFAAQPMVVEHFLDEARLASRLIHPNIIQIDDLGKAGDEYFIAMEYIDGADLERLLSAARERGEQVPLRVALAVLRKICDGLHAAHIATAADGKPLDLVHRDVKSANVFVARNGVVKVGDFGIVKANIASRVNKTEIGVVKGTAAYMAPEHRIGQVVDRRADLYAVGAIAYELLSGQEVDLDLAILADKGKAGWPHLAKPSAVRPELPPSLDTIVFRALAYEKDARYADCSQLEEAFDQVAAETGGAASDKVIAQWVESLLSREARPTPAASAS